MLLGNCCTVQQQVGGTYIKFCFWFRQSGKVCTIHKEDNAIDGREVVFPHSAGCVNTHKRESVWSVCFCYRHFAFRQRFDYVLQVCLLQNNYQCLASSVFRWWWPRKLEYLKPKTSVHTSYLVSGLLGQRWWKSCQQLSALQKLVGKKK